MGQFSQQVSHVMRRAAKKATEQGGIIDGANPAAYNASDPFPLFVIQAVIIIAMTQFLVFFFKRIHQPRVIAEIIGGIILGPSVFGHIPGFTANVFPPASLPLLNLVSTIGLVLFLFLVGLEIDAKIMKRNATVAANVSLAGLLIPLGLGAALGVAIYKEFANPSLNFGYFLLFTAVAVGITAFPVLCRILTELKLLNTTVGVVTLAAGVGNDIVGWILLALTVTLVNASSGLTALYILISAVGFILLFMYPGRWAYYWLAKYSGSLEQGAPTTGMMTLTLLLILATSFFTDVIGIHPVFGGFLTGLIIPHENGYAISMVEKVEDLVSLLLLPIYFALSGLKTNLGSLNTGKAWGYTVLLCVVSFSAKFFSCLGVAAAGGFNWRESGAIGALMACKGLVELIVLNIGLQAGILDTRTFSMFVLHAVVLTFITTPLTLAFYPPKYQTRPGVHFAETGALQPVVSEPDDDAKTRFALVLDRIEQLPAAMTITHLLQGNNIVPNHSSTSVNEESEKAVVSYSCPEQPISINALRLIELTNRSSAVLKSHLSESVSATDPVVSVFKTFGYLNRLAVSAALSIVVHDEFTTAIIRHVDESRSQMVILPWSRAAPSAVSETNQSGNPFDRVVSQQHLPEAVVYSEFIRRVFATAQTSVALFVDSGHGAPYTRANDGSVTQHLFLPFLGGPDDRLALTFVVQLCRTSSVKATVIRLEKGGDDASVCEDVKDGDGKTVVVAPHGTFVAADTVYGQHSTQARIISETADNVLWNRYTAETSTLNADTVSALSRITFSTRQTARPLHTIAELVSKDQAKNLSVIVVAGRSRRLAVESHDMELQQMISEDGSLIGSSMPKTLGQVGAALVAKRTSASLLIVQAHTGSS